MEMVISAVATLALYCPCCGKIQMHDISRFDLKAVTRRDFLCSCGQHKATMTSTGRQCLLDIPCVVCQTNHIICLDSKQFWHTDLDKIYCSQENLELGFVGNRQAVEQIIAAHKREFESFVHEMDDDAQDENIEDSQIMLEILNKVHDIAEKGGVYCHCGSTAIRAAVLPTCIELECVQCGSMKTIQAKNEQDLAYSKKLDTIELVPRRRSSQK
jgi:hypothetical protein